jgi:hypothetical protein
MHLYMAAVSALQVDAAPDRPARGELKERATPAKAGTPIEGMIIGANSNTYLRRGATFDVMRNVEAGVEDTGAVEGAAGRGPHRARTHAAPCWLPEVPWRWLRMRISCASK